MSDFDPVNHSKTYREKVNYIVPERIREACTARGLSYEDASARCDIDRIRFGMMANGHEDIPDDMIFKLMAGLDFPKQFFYQIKWERC